MNIKNIAQLCFIAILATLSFISCSKDEPAEILPGELDGLQLAKTISNEDHTVEIYTASGKFQTGYNQIFFQVKDKNKVLINNATASWTPTMTMMSMSHSCPASAVSKKQGAASTYTGYIIFQMASNDMEFWELGIDYKINGTDYSVKDKIQVDASAKRVSESFQGNDGKRYILALVEPSEPKVATNDMTVALYQMETMMKFVPVDNYKIIIDPRMPGMGNHGSPNNVNLSQGTDKLYHGKLSLTMTGYWKINLQLADAAENIQKGEAVTAENESSSIYFEIEF